MQEAIGEEIAESRRFLMVTLWFGLKRDGYGTKDGGHDISCPYKARRWRCEVAAAKSKIRRAKYAQEKRWRPEGRRYGFKIPTRQNRVWGTHERGSHSGRSSARMRIDPSTSVSPAMYFR